MKTDLQKALQNCYESADKIITSSWIEYWLTDDRVIISPQLPDGQHYRLNFTDNKVERLVIWPDLPFRHPDILQSRLAHFIGKSQSVYGRNTTIVYPDLTDTKNFHNRNHLLGGIHNKRNIGLTVGQTLIAVASFSRPCPIDRAGTRYNSIELNRIAFKNGVHVAGGLSKLIKAAENHFQTDDIMTRIDLDFGNGSGFINQGFDWIQNEKPIQFWINQERTVRLYEKDLPTWAVELKSTNERDTILHKQGWTSCQGCGGIKLIKYRK